MLNAGHEGGAYKIYIDTTVSGILTFGSLKDGFIRSSSEGGFSLKHFPLGLERNMLLIENSRVRLAVPQGLHGAEGVF